MPATSPATTTVPVYAGFGRRVAATLLDAAGPLLLVLLARFVLWLSASNRPEDEPTMLAVLIAAGLGGLSVLCWVWNQILVQGPTGQSFGKAVLGITLVRVADLQPLGAPRAAGRALAQMLNSLTLMLGWLAALVDPRRRTLADHLVDTVVVTR
ncbi:RDD family protein [Nocardioides sp.]|uniref:RDD family protein n=1 Tax=Nocardioides sp. TaxID=35761 RepID=UPI003517B1FD